MALEDILQRIRRAERRAQRAEGSVALVAVSKVQPIDRIEAALEAGHRRFGENRVQEAQEKWPRLRERRPDVALHLIGPLQSNKTKPAVALFDVIESLDREKLLARLVEEMRAQDRAVKLLVQVNTGEEPQKAGVSPRDAVSFVEMARERYAAPIAGFMAIPPAEDVPEPHFALLAGLAREARLPELSMGMSADFEAAIAQGATSVRVGSAVFGPRTPQG